MFSYFQCNTYAIASSCNEKQDDQNFYALTCFSYLNKYVQIHSNFSCNPEHYKFDLKH